MILDEGFLFSITAALIEEPGEFDVAIVAYDTGYSEETITAILRGEIPLGTDLDAYERGDSEGVLEDLGIYIYGPEEDEEYG